MLLLPFLSPHKTAYWHQRASEGWFSWTHIADLLLRLLQSQELRCVHDLAVSFPFILLKVLLVVNLQLETRQTLYSSNENSLGAQRKAY